VDIDYLLSQMQVDDDGLICLPAKAMRAAEHFLLCRYFDYQQVSYHKTVAGLERVLVCVISTLLRDRAIMCSQDDIQNMITDGRWHTFDDAFLVGHMRTLAGSSDPVVAAQVRAILERNPPRLVFEEEQIVDRKGSDALKHMKKRVEGQIDSWADEFHIDRSLWYPWERKQTITKIGSHVPIPDRLSGESDGTGEDDTDEECPFQLRIGCLPPVCPSARRTGRASAPDSR
jgi:HD superfamily phosphohydrolase